MCFKIFSFYCFNNVYICHVNCYIIFQFLWIFYWINYVRSFPFLTKLYHHNVTDAVFFRFSKHVPKVLRLSKGKKKKSTSLPASLLTKRAHSIVKGFRVRQTSVAPNYTFYELNGLGQVMSVPFILFLEQSFQLVWKSTQRDHILNLSAFSW